MFTDLSPLLHKADVSLRMGDLLLQKGSWVRGSDKFKNDEQTSWFANTFVVDLDPVLVRYPLSDIIADQDYVDVQLWNLIGTAPSPGVDHPTVAYSKRMYPTKTNVLYQIAVGMKPGPYFVLTNIPKGTTPIYQLGSTDILPSVDDPAYRYLGAKYPQDSPEESPTWYLYAINQGPQITLTKFMDGGDTEVGGTLYGKASIVYNINKCHLSAITPVNLPVGVTMAQVQEKALYIPHPTELTGF